jgi:hypothetical protein
MRESSLYGHSFQNCFTREVLNKKLCNKYHTNRGNILHINNMYRNTYAVILYHVHSNKSTNTRCCQDCQGCWEELSKHICSSCTINIHIHHNQVKVVPTLLHCHLNASVIHVHNWVAKASNLLFKQLYTYINESNIPYT